VRVEAEGRYQREKDFHDSTPSQRWQAVSKFYDVAEPSLTAHRGLVLRECRGRRVLDYGCGEGETSLLLSGHGAVVTGIDISARRIETARQASEGFANLSFHAMNAEQLTFDDRSFDLVCGTSILHHLDLDRALGEIARTLTPEGKAIFLEPLGHNPLIKLYRRLTPRFRTDDEHPLVMRDLEVFERHFGSVETSFFHLTSLASVVTHRTRFFPTVSRALEGVDGVLFSRLPFTRRYAWIVVLVLARPRSAGLANAPSAA
jgi:ubiquinone/menaquinone biosynthesis C-methylase UbiE